MEESSGMAAEAAETVGTEGVAEVTAEQFFLNFRSEQQAIEQEMAALTADSERVHEVLDELLLRVQALETGFMQSAHLLPRHDLARSNSALKTLTTGIEARRQQLAPRKKFSFKRREPRAKAAAVAVQPAGEGVSSPQPAGDVPAQSVPATPSSAPFSGSDGLVIADQKATSVVKGDGDLAGRDVSLKALEGCRVVLLDQVGALHCHGLRNCEVIVGAIESSALLYDCHECVIILAAKQLRLHDSDCISLHLHTLSGPVIEHCRRIAVSPYDLTYPEVEKHWAAASLGALTHLAAPASMSGTWADVQDFNWHKRQASPNWCVLQASLRPARRECTHAASLAADESLPPRLEELDQCRVAWEAGHAEPKDEEAV